MSRTGSQQRQAGKSLASPAANLGSTALQIVDGMKPRNYAARAHRKTVLQRCLELNEEMQRESKLKQQLAVSIILDGVIEIDDCEEIYR